MPVSVEKRVSTIQFLILSVLIVLTALVLHPIVKITETRMNELKNNLISALEEKIDYEISYTSISPSILSYINIKDFRLFRNGDPEDFLLKVKTLKVFYSPFYFFSKARFSNPLEAIGSIVISGASVQIDQAKDKNLIGALNSGSGQAVNLKLFPFSTKVSGRDIYFEIQTEQGNLKTGNLSLSVIPENQGYRTRADGSLELTLPENSEIPVGSANARFSARGSFSDNLESFNFTVKTKELSTDLFTLADQSLQLISTAEGLEIRKVQDNRPLDLAMRFDRELGDFIFSFNTVNFQPSSILDFRNSMAEYNRYLTSEVSGSGSLMIGGSNPSPVYSLQTEIKLNKNLFNRSVYLKSDLTGDINQINIRSLDCRIPEGRLLFNGNLQTDTFFPEGNIRLVDLVPSDGYRINSSIHVENRDGFLNFRSNNLSINNETLDAVSLIVYPEKTDISASLKAQYNGGELTVDAIAGISVNPDFSLYVSAENLPFQSIVSLLPDPLQGNKWPVEFTDSQLSANMTMTGNRETYKGMISRISLVSSKNRKDNIALSGNFDSEGININNFSVSWYGYDADGYANSSHIDEEYRVLTSFDLQDHPYRIELVYKDQNLVVQGNYGLFGFLNKEADQSYSYNFNTTSFPLPYDGNIFYADLNVSGQIEGSSWNAFLENSKIMTDQWKFLSEPEIRITAQVNSGGADIYDLRYKDSRSALKGLGRVSYSPLDVSTWMTLIDETGKSEEQYNVYFSLAGRNLDSRVSIKSTPLDRFTDTGLGGNLSLDLAFSGSLDDPEYQAVIETDRLTVDNVPVSFSSFIQGDRTGIRVSDLELNYNGIMFNRGLVLLELSQGKLLATGGVTQAINDSRASTSLTLKIESDKSMDIFRLGDWLDADLQGTLSMAPITWNNLRTFPGVNIALNKKGQVFTGTAAQGKVLSGSYNLADGQAVLAVKDLFPFRFDARGKITDGQIDAEVNNLVFYPSFLNYFMPVDPYKGKRVVVFTDGTIKGDIVIAGPVTDPDFTGTLRVSNLIPESPFLAEIPEPVDTTAHLEGHDLILDPFSIVLKKGTIDVDSSFEFDSGLPTVYNVDVSFKGPDGPRISYAIPGFSWDGHFTGDTHIEGSRSGGFLKGDLLCNDLISSLESDAVPPETVIKPKNPSVNGFTVDLTIHTGREVNFFFPNLLVPIIQATADNGDAVNIAYDSRSDILALTGKVDIRTGEINYFGKKFFLQEGFIEFNENQVKFNPRLNVRADIVTKDDLGDDVTISLLFDDYLLNEFNPEFLSFPGKSENEILALLGQSFIPSNDPEQVSVASLLVATGGMIGKSTIMQPFEEIIKSSLNLDFVSFNTNLIENAILDRFQDRNFNASDRSVMNFARYLEGTSLFVGEYIGDFLFLEGSLVVDYDDSHSVSSAMSGLALNFNFDLQFITPFVLIDWSYNPKNNPGSDYFFPQNTITFTWQYSY